LITSYYKFAAISLLAVVYLGGCSQDFLSKEKDAGSEESDENETADQPVEVSGAFITNVKIFCSHDGFKVENVGAQSNLVVSCIIKNADGTRFNLPITSISSVIQVENKIVNSQTELSSGPPWHFYIETTPEDRKKISLGQFEIVTEGKTEKVETTVFDYKWNEDPIFALLVIALSARPNQEKVADTMEMIEKVHGENVQLAFVSDDIFGGNFGVEKADTYCDQEGKKVVASRSWKALIGSPTQTVRERIEIKRPVLNLFGQWLSSIEKDRTHEERFWTEVHGTGFRMTQTGKDTHLFEQYDSRLQVVDTAWTGFDTNGANDTEFGNCNNWTSNDSTLTGGVADSRSVESRWARFYKIKCDGRARIICISQ
jgi:hypothetical protein